VNKFKIALALIFSIALLFLGACKADVVTTTVKTTVTPAAQTVTTTTTATSPAVTQTVTETKTVTATATASQSTTSTTPTTTKTTTTTTSTTTTSSLTFEPVLSPDGKLQVTVVNFTSGTSGSARIKLTNLSGETLNARVTLEFLAADGEVAVVNGLDQIQTWDVTGIAAGAEKIHLFEADRVDASSTAGNDAQVNLRITVVVVS
jgi:hypothetical protein